MGHDTAQSLWLLINSHALVRCVHVIAEAGVADELEDHPTGAAELAQRCHLNPDALHRMMRLLAAQGIFALENGLFSHTEASQLLRSDHSGSLRPLARMLGTPVMWDGFTKLEAAARTGRPSLEWPELVSYLSNHPAEATLFNQAMAAKSASAIPAIIEAYDFAGPRVIADLGGGRGHLLEAILQSHSAATGVLFDLPHVIAEIANSASSRLKLMAGDFFSSDLPAADVYTLMDVLHDWSDQDVQRILAAIRRVAPAGAKVLIIESLIVDGPGLHPSKVLDVVMLALTGGRERTAAQYEALLPPVGFTLRRTLPTTSHFSIVEAVAS